MKTQDSAETMSSLNVLSCAQTGRSVCCCSSSDESETVPPQRNKRATANGFVGMLLSVALAFFPKCPFCWGAYLSLFGVAGLESIPYMPWLKPLIIAAMGCNLWFLYRTCSRREFHLPFFVSTGGVALILLNTFGSPNDVAIPTGIGLMLFSTLLLQLPTQARRVLRLSHPA